MNETWYYDPTCGEIRAVGTERRVAYIAVLNFSERNGELLAAAPDLFASLQEIVAEWGTPNTPKWHRARAALAKAKNGNAA